MKDCLFCKIFSGDIPASKIYESEKVIGFKDLYPQAKIHHLFIHKNHTSSVQEMKPSEVAEIFSAIREWSLKESNIKNGFRIVTNSGLDAGQSVFHTHFHLLGGEPLGRFGTGL
jgi:histidine triad (HIT) family protein